MVTSEEIREEALRLAQSKTDMEEAVADILARCSNKRVAVVRARQSLTDLRQQDPGVRGDGMGPLHVQRNLGCPAAIGPRMVGATVHRSGQVVAQWHA